MLSDFYGVDKGACCLDVIRASAINGETRVLRYPKNHSQQRMIRIFKDYTHNPKLPRLIFVKDIHEKRRVSRYFMGSCCILVSSRVRKSVWRVRIVDVVASEQAYASVGIVRYKQSISSGSPSELHPQNLVVPICENSAFAQSKVAV